MTNPDVRSTHSFLSQQEIDGKALLLLTREMIMSYMGLKLGPAIKLLGCIEDLKPKKSRWNIYLDAYISFCGASLIPSFQKNLVRTFFRVGLRTTEFILRTMILTKCAQLCWQTQGKTWCTLDMYIGEDNVRDIYLSFNLYMDLLNTISIISIRNYYI